MQTKQLPNNTHLDHIQLQTVLLKPPANLEWVTHHNSALPSIAIDDHLIRLPTSLKRKANTQKKNDVQSSYQLKERILGDVMVASVVTTMVAPFLTVIDKVRFIPHDQTILNVMSHLHFTYLLCFQAIVQSSTGAHSMLESAMASFQTMVRHPTTYVKSPAYKWMWGTYAATYSAANVINTLGEYTEQRTREAAVDSYATTTTDANPPTNDTNKALLVGTTLVNTTASLFKDRAFVRMFGMDMHTVPFLSYALWISRDVATVGSSFVMPMYVSNWLQTHEVTWFDGMDQDTVNTWSQIGTPVVAQTVAGPLHSMGLDWYHRAHASWTSRLSYMISHWPSVVGARMLRILPGYGVEVYNTQFRDQWHAFLTSHTSAAAHSLHMNTMRLSRAQTMA
jgi:hypothetical protein